MAVQISRRLFSIDEYHRMAEAGIFAEDDRVELIEGEIVVMSPIGNPHAAGVRRLIRLFTGSLGDAVIVDAQNPVRLDDWSEPQPDIALLQPRSDFYASKSPAAENVLLLVEVADSSVVYDRDVKVPFYARHGVRECWLVDLPGEVLEVYSQPAQDGYRSVRRLRRGDKVSLEAFPGVTFAVESILG